MIKTPITKAKIFKMNYLLINLTQIYKINHGLRAIKLSGTNKQAYAAIIGIKIAKSVITNTIP